MKAYDLLVQAESGLVSVSGAPGEWGRIGVSLCDINAGLNALIGIQQALMQRERSGRGSAVKVSLFDSAAELMSVPYLQARYGGKAPERVGLMHPSIAPYGAFTCADGRDIVISIQNEREWADFCRHVLRMPELLDDPRCASNATRVAHRGWVDGQLAAVFGALANGELIERLMRAQTAFGSVNSVDDLIEHPQLRTRRMPVGDRVVEVPASPWSFEWDAEGFAPAPAVDQHAEAIRAEFAGPRAPRQRDLPGDRRERAADDALAQARSLLFVPGNRPERFTKALASGADGVVLDLEDSVPPSDKAAARAAVWAALPGLLASGLPLVVRINAPDTPAGAADVDGFAALAGLASAVALMVPKAETRESLDRLAARLPATVLLPLIESAAGHAALAQLAGGANVLRLAVGHIDFMADTGLQCSADEPELAPLRFAVAMATRLHGLAAAIDGVTVDIGDERRLHDDTRRALRFGFGGKLCIHPRQIAGVHEAMAPSEAERAWAERVIAADAASGGAAVQLDGRMVDAPVVQQSRRLLARVRPLPA